MQEKSRLIKSLASQQGFDACGIAKAQPLDQDARRLEKWLKSGHQGSMQYMERNFDMTMLYLQLLMLQIIPKAKVSTGILN